MIGKDQNGVNGQITGEGLWDAYQDIREIAKCDKGGHKKLGNGCAVHVDYYYSCDNRDSGSQRRADLMGIAYRSLLGLE
jgi:hypothetical protein